MHFEAGFFLTFHHFTDNGAATRQPSFTRNPLTLCQRLVESIFLPILPREVRFSGATFVTLTKLGSDFLSLLGFGHSNL